MSNADFKPDRVASYYATLSAVSFATVWAPFVPETLFAVGLVSFLTSHLDLGRRWNVATRIPANLGARNYIDANTKSRGDASIPCGFHTDTKEQLWLTTDDLKAIRVVRNANDREQTNDMLRMAFSLFLNGASIAVLSPTDHEQRAKALRELATPFGRDADLFALNCDDPDASISLPVSAYLAAPDASGDLQAAADLAATVPAFDYVASLQRRHMTPSLCLSLSSSASLSDLLKGRFQSDDETVDLPGTNLEHHEHLRGLLSAIAAYSDDERNALADRLSAIFEPLSKIACLNRPNPIAIAPIVAAGRSVLITASAQTLRPIIAAAFIQAQPTSSYLYFTNADLLSPAETSAFAGSFRTLAFSGSSELLPDAPITLTFGAQPRLKLSLPTLTLDAPYTPFSLDDRPEPEPNKTRNRK